MSSVMIPLVFLFLADTAGKKAPPKKAPLAPPAKVVEEPGIVYGKGGDQELKLDLARPAQGEGPFPGIICIHGGGWQAGKHEDLRQLIRFLAERGFVAVTISYRLAPAAKFPAQVEDCKAAVRWLRANAARYHVDPDHLGVMGFSAGGHLACLLGAADARAGLEGQGGHPERSSRVQAVVSFFGPTDFLAPEWKDNVNKILVDFLGARRDENPEIYKKASPITYVSKDDPPFLFFHGTKDPLVNIRQSERMVQRLQEVGVPARLVRLEGAGHGWGGEQLHRTLEQTVAFFREHLRR